MKTRAGRHDEAANRAWWHASTLRTIARRAHLAAHWVAVGPLLKAWGAVAERVHELTATWPGVLADAAGALPATEEGRAALRWADEPRRAWFGSGKLQAPPLVRPLMERLAGAMAVSREQGNLEAVLAEPAPIPPPPIPGTTARARTQYRESAARTKMLEADLMRHHVRRERAEQLIEDAEARWRHVWWTTWTVRAGDCAGRREDALRVAESLREEARLLLVRALDSLRPKEARPPATKTSATGAKARRAKPKTARPKTGRRRR